MAPPRSHPPDASTHVSTPPGRARARAPTPITPRVPRTRDTHPNVVDAGSPLGPTAVAPAPTRTAASSRPPAPPSPRETRRAGSDRSPRRRSGSPAGAMRNTHRFPPRGTAPQALPPAPDGPVHPRRTRTMPSGWPPDPGPSSPGSSCRTPRIPPRARSPCTARSAPTAAHPPWPSPASSRSGSVAPASPPPPQTRTLRSEMDWTAGHRAGAGPRRCRGAWPKRSRAVPPPEDRPVDRTNAGHKLQTERPVYPLSVARADRAARG